MPRLGSDKYYSSDVSCAKNCALHIEARRGSSQASYLEACGTSLRLSDQVGTVMSPITRELLSVATGQQ
jgi:hypothetical protein